MKRINFSTRTNDGDESVMPVGRLNIAEIRFNRKSREIIICCDDTFKYTLEGIDQLSWQAIKRMVVEEGGEWSDKKTGIDFLLTIKAMK